jgi:3'(2'), 5'-bisphosphate nucleotidase
MISLAISAGAEVMSIYASDFAERIKSDLSPVTEADEAAERIILAGLARADPATPVISEEAYSAGKREPAGDRFYLVDPLDGTREFLSRNGEFTVNIALVEKAQPMAGVVFAPALSLLYAAQVGLGGWRAQVTDGAAENWTPIACRVTPPEGPTVIASRSHRDPETERFLKKIKPKHLISAGSSLKFCRIAEGLADLYPRFGRTMEWDTAAGHAILLAAGGKVVMEDGTPLRYGKQERGFDNPAFIASGREFAIR